MTAVIATASAASRPSIFDVCEPAARLATTGVSPGVMAALALGLIATGGVVLVRSRRAAAALVAAAALAVPFLSPSPALANGGGTDPCTASIGDFVWHDQDRDGIQDAGEPGIDGVRVVLLDGAGRAVLETTSSGGGRYLFDLLPAGVYQVSFPEQVDGMILAAQQMGADEALDSNPESRSGLTASVALAQGHVNPTIDAGYVLQEPAPAPSPTDEPTEDPTDEPTDEPTEEPTTDPEPMAVSIGDYVWWDVNRNGQQDPGEPPAPGVTVNLYWAEFLIAVTTTDANGYYSFTNLVPSTAHVVEFLAPDGASFTVQGDAGTPLGSSADASGQSDVVTPAAGSNLATFPDDPTIDAGLVAYDLLLTKALASEGPYVPGSIVIFTLTPHDVGPADALAGWTVTDVLPDGLELVSFTGEGYDISGTTATALFPLCVGSEAPILTVTARVADGAPAGELRNVAYVLPAAGDAAERIPASETPPTPETDTDASPTNNDAEAGVIVEQPR